MAGKKSSGNREQRTRTWSCILYEDSSARLGYILDNEHIEWIESPWHDKDINGDGSPKKKHKAFSLAFWRCQIL